MILNTVTGTYSLGATSSSGAVTINGGTIKANKTIGGVAGALTINGGDVTALALGHRNTYNTAPASSVTITGGNVTCTGISTTGNIGGVNTTVAITGGTINCPGNIGGKGSTISIDNATITCGNCIGGTNASITIDGGTIDVKGTGHRPAIGGYGD